jgi:hypothetical protein
MSKKTSKTVTETPKSKTKTVATVKNETAKASPIGESAASGENKAKLKQCEDIIRQNESGVFMTGRNLAQINKDELYKADDFTSFEVYCKERWGMSDKHAYRLMKAAECYDALAKQAPKTTWVLPRNESQIRTLANLTEAEWVPTWEKVMKKFGNKQFTADDIDEVINPVVKKTAGATDADAAADETAKNKTDKILKENLAKIEVLVSKALKKANINKAITLTDYLELLEQIQELIPTSK